jgi:hypothetical protein
MWDVSQSDGMATLSEMDIILGPETELAKALGETPRTDHSGAVVYKTLSPTTTNPYDPQKLKEAINEMIRRNKAKYAAPEVGGGINCGTCCCEG